MHARERTRDWESKSELASVCSEKILCQLCAFVFFLQFLFFCVSERAKQKREDRREERKRREECVCVRERERERGRVRESEGGSSETWMKTPFFSHARPKSASLSKPRESTSRFSGLMSRCTTLHRCR